MIRLRDAMALAAVMCVSIPAMADNKPDDKSPPTAKPDKPKGEKHAPNSKHAAKHKDSPKPDHPNK